MSEGPRERLRRHVPAVIAVLSALVMFSVPLGIMTAISEEQPEVRVLETGSRLSALIVDNDTRILVINSPDREEAVASLGRFAQPWEPRPRALIAPSDDRAAIGLWEVFSHLQPGHVIVAGIPGADPIWSAVERECERRNVTLSFVSSRTLIRTGRLEVTVMGSGTADAGARSVVVRHGLTNIVVALDEQPPRVPGQLLITNGDRTSSRADLIIVPRPLEHLSRPRQLVVGSRDRVRIVLEPDRVRVFGGQLIPTTGG